MKILYITPDLSDSGGISRVVSSKVNYFVSVLDYKVDIIAPTPYNSSFFYDFDSKINWHPCIDLQKNVFFLSKSLTFIKKILAEQKPDILIICDAPNWVALPWFLRVNIPIVLETHFSTSLKRVVNKGLWNDFRYNLVYFLKKKTLKRFDKVVYVTNAGLSEWNPQNGLVIPNPISFVTSTINVLQNKKVIAVCKHTYEKGLDRLLLIWQAVSKKHSDWELNVYGDWDNSMQYHQMASDLKILTTVNFLAATRDIQTGFEDSSVFLMTSRSEAFGMALLEAMSCGLPSVVFDCPCGPSQIITNGQEGFLIEEGNIDLFVEKALSLIEDQNLRRQMGTTARESSQKYDLAVVMNEWNDLLLSLLK